MEQIAIIDIGSNSVRLVCYDVHLDRYEIMHNDKTICGLGRNLEKDGKLSKTGKKLALENLKRFKDHLNTNGIKKVYPIATEAVRGAKDGEDFIEQIQKKTGFALYDMHSDPYEKGNVIHLYPQITQKLKEYAQKHQAKFYP